MQNYKAVGIIDPIYIDEDFEILAGHKRYLAAKELDLKQVQVLRIIGLSEQQKKIYRIASNKLTHNSEWNFENLISELEEIKIDLPELNITLPQIGLDFNFLKEDEEIPTIPEVETKEKKEKLIKCPSCEHIFNVNNC